MYWVYFVLIFKKCLVLLCLYWVIGLAELSNLLALICTYSLHIRHIIKIQPHRNKDLIAPNLCLHFRPTHTMKGFIPIIHNGPWKPRILPRSRAFFDSKSLRPFYNITDIGLLYHNEYGKTLLPRHPLPHGGRCTVPLPLFFRHVVKGSPTTFPSPLDPGDRSGIGSLRGPRNQGG